MKCRYKNRMISENIIDWKVQAICDDEYKKDSDHLIMYETFGFAKYGYGEIRTYGKISDANRITNIINSFGESIVSGEIFQENVIHTFGDDSITKNYEFSVSYMRHLPKQERYILLSDLNIFDKPVMR